MSFFCHIYSLRVTSSDSFVPVSVPALPAGLLYTAFSPLSGRRMKKIAIFADVQNIFYTTRDRYQRQFNYRAFWQKVSQQGVILCANAYAIDRGMDSQRAFQKALRHIGFTVKLKPYIQRKDGTAKGDWDVGITIDALGMAARVNHILLLSGDGDFSLLLEEIKQNHGVTTEVYGVESLTADALIQSADHFHPITKDLLL